MSTAKAIDALVRDIAREVVREALASIPATAVDSFVDQRTCGFDRHVFMRAARAGAFPASKVERLWIAKRSDVTTWLESKRPKGVAVVALANDGLDDLRRAAGIRPKRKAA